MTAPVLTAFYAGILGLIGLLLAVNVVAGRIKNRVEIGDGGKDNMMQRMRAFGNFIEYVPLIVLLLALGETLGSPKWLTHVVGIGLIVGRLAHAQGLMSTKGRSAGRFVGTNLTWLALAAASIALIARALAMKPF